MVIAGPGQHLARIHEQPRARFPRIQRQIVPPQPKDHPASSSASRILSALTALASLCAWRRPAAKSPAMRRRASPASRGAGNLPAEICAWMAERARPVGAKAGHGGRILAGPPLRQAKPRCNQRTCRRGHDGVVRMRHSPTETGRKRRPKRALVGVVGLEPTLLAKPDFESGASTIPPHPRGALVQAGLARRNGIALRKGRCFPPGGHSEHGHPPPGIKAVSALRLRRNAAFCKPRLRPGQALPAAPRAAARSRRRRGRRNASAAWPRPSGSPCHRRLSRSP